MIVTYLFTRCVSTSVHSCSHTLLSLCTLNKQAGNVDSVKMTIIVVQCHANYNVNSISSGVNSNILLYRLSYDELTNEIDRWKDEIDDVRNDLEQDPPSDVKEQMDVFLPVRRY